MPTVSIGTTDKRINSTKQTFSSAFSADCKLKEPCSMQAPVFIVQGLSKGTLYNYCQFEGRYYWVDDVVYKTNDIVEVHCHLDALSTYKDAIKATKAFCQLADEAHWNKFMDDTRISPEREDNANSTTETKDMSAVFSTTGTIIVKTFCTAWDFSSSWGGVVTWAVNPNDFRQMLSSYYSKFDGKTIEEIAGRLGGMGTLKDNILSCIWVPFTVTGSSTNNLLIGAVDTGVSAYIVNELVEQELHGDFLLDWSFANDNPYLKNSRWTSLQVITPFGYGEISPERLVDTGYVYIKLNVCKTTGDVIFSVWEHGYGNGTCFGAWSANVSVDMMSMLGGGKGIIQQLQTGIATGAKLAASAFTFGMGQGVSSMAVTSAAQQVNDAGVATFAGTAKPGQLASAYDNYEKTKMQQRVSAVSSGVDFAQSLPSGMNISAPGGSIGGNNALALWLLDNFATVKLVRKVFNYTDSANYKTFCGTHGFPCNKFLTLGDVTGFVKCSGASVDTSTASEASKSTINSFLNGCGVYIE